MKEDKSRRWFLGSAAAAGGAGLAGYVAGEHKGKERGKAEAEFEERLRNDSLVPLEPIDDCYEKDNILFGSKDAEELFNELSTTMVGTHMTDSDGRSIGEKVPYLKVDRDEHGKINVVSWNFGDPITYGVPGILRIRKIDDKRFPKAIAMEIPTDEKFTRGQKIYILVKQGMLGKREILNIDHGHTRSIRLEGLKRQWKFIEDPK